MNTKSITTFVFMLLCSFVNSLVFAQDKSEVMKQGNDFYKAGEYKLASESYESILSSGLESAALYFNLGNAYYKQGEPTKAILNFERALLLDPKDENIRYNLSMANSSVIDKIEQIPEPPLTRWQNNMLQRRSADGWGFRSMVGFLLGIFCIGIFLFTSKVGRKRLSFFAAILLFIFSGITYKFASQQRAKIDDHPEAIIFERSVTVKGSPNENGTDLFIIHEGLKVKITDSIGEWKEVKIADGNKGWVKESVMVRI